MLSRGSSARRRPALIATPRRGPRKFLTTLEWLICFFDGTGTRQGPANGGNKRASTIFLRFSQAAASFSSIDLAAAVSSLSLIPLTLVRSRFCAHHARLRLCRRPRHRRAFPRCRRAGPVRCVARIEPLPRCPSADLLNPDSEASSSLEARAIYRGCSRWQECTDLPIVDNSHHWCHWWNKQNRNVCDWGEFSCFPPRPHCGSRSY